jgi:hypothetical protein
MPTPRPIIATIEIVKSGIAMTWLRMPTSADAMPRPNSAMPIGRPIASTEPKATIRMMTAAMMPRSSLSGSSNLPNGSPPYSSCTPAGVGCSSPKFRIFSPRSCTSVKLRSLIDREAKAISPFLLTCCGFWSGNTTVTPGCWAAKSPIAFISACAAGSLAYPCGTFMTIWPDVPASFGELAWSRSNTCFVSLLGSLKSVL